MITNFGSICIDNVYQVPYFVNPGESLPCLDYQVHPGGKGLNQSLAIAFAGGQVRHAGKIGEDGVWMKTLMDDAGIDTRLTRIAASPTGHANIQVTPDGENAIVLFGGANRTVTENDVREVLSSSAAGDFLLIQNEISSLPTLIELAAAHGQRIVFNAAPITAEVNRYPLDKIELFIVNEVEGAAISGKEEPEMILNRMLEKFPNSGIVLTLGAEGAIYQDSAQRISQPASPVTPVDTTGAGDTFIGYFLAGYSRGDDIGQCIKLGCDAAALSVTRQGAATSIPRLAELQLQAVTGPDNP